MQLKNEENTKKGFKKIVILSFVFYIFVNNVLTLSVSWILCAGVCTSEKGLISNVIFYKQSII